MTMQRISIRTYSSGFCSASSNLVVDQTEQNKADYSCLSITFTILWEVVNFVFGLDVRNNLYPQDRYYYVNNVNKQNYRNIINLSLEKYSLLLFLSTIMNDPAELKWIL